MPPAEEQKHVSPAPSEDRPARSATGAPRPAGEPVSRDFVVRVAPDSPLEEGRLSGRVHHLATTDGGNFDSAEGLVAIMRRVLDRETRRNADSD